MPDAGITMPLAHNQEFRAETPFKSNNSIADGIIPPFLYFQWNTFPDLVNGRWHWSLVPGNRE